MTVKSALAVAAIRAYGLTSEMHKRIESQPALVGETAPDAFFRVGRL